MVWRKILRVEPPPPTSAPSISSPQPLHIVQAVRAPAAKNHPPTIAPPTVAPQAAPLLPQLHQPSGAPCSIQAPSIELN